MNKKLKELLACAVILTISAGGVLLTINYFDLSADTYDASGYFGLVVAMMLGIFGIAALMYGWILSFGEFSNDIEMLALAVAMTCYLIFGNPEVWSVVIFSALSVLYVAILAYNLLKYGGRYLMPADSSGFRGFNGGAYIIIGIILIASMVLGGLALNEGFSFS